MRNAPVRVAQNNHAEVRLRELPTFADAFDACDRLLPTEGLQVLGMCNVHADVRLQGDDNGVVAKVAREMGDDQVILQQAESEAVEVKNGPRSRRLVGVLPSLGHADQVPEGNIMSEIYQCPKR